jgi:hypothetical protein
VEPVEWLSIAGALLLVGTTVELVRRRQLREEYALGWILSSVALLAVALRREILHSLARVLGIHYPPAALLLVLLLLVIVSALALTVVLSRQRAEFERLVEEFAVLKAQVRELSAQSPLNESPARTRHAGDLESPGPRH